MKHATISSLLLALTLSLGFAVTPNLKTASATATVTTASVAQTFTPPAHLATHRKPRKVDWRRKYQDADVRYDMLSKSITVSWAGYYDEVSDFMDSEKVTFPLGYFPTDVDMAREDVMLIAGIDDDGDTVIERYKFRWPFPSTAPFTEYPSGITTYALEIPTHTGTKRCYEGSVVGKNHVRFLLAIQGTQTGTAPKALVQFDDSRDLYVVNIGTNTMSLLASPTSTQGTIGVVPFLDDEHTFSWKADHDDFGYIYVFGFDNNGDVGDPPTLVLVDTDRDCVIDNYLTVPPGQWLAPWNDADKYNWSHSD